MEWKIIPGYSGYEASNTGLLRSLNYKSSRKVRILKPAISDGYLKTMLKGDDGKFHSYNVHKFVTLAFLGNRPAGLEVNHKDGNKLNNDITNLEYVTHSENVQNAFDMGLAKGMKGEKNPFAKLTENQVREIRDYVYNFQGRYYGRKALAEKYGISDSYIKDIVSKRRGTWNFV